ncbi:Palmitoyltransferase akr1 [Xylona heveae TC161]|uniref:Palmitoyltransferase n=1 Tax=Xylona heveae (strain CBS 132557 / TC161) TaxID=1328760 RepID=A0A165FZ83_XYLHT|nr:Palmitoyltransferase akr1 [Xylona heveae TC161]KZF21557.1 Palmitoyltransferase akr1 [Xylona heveae TC161]
MWAVQRCHYYVVHLLLQHGADPLLTDNQGFNMLHLATFDGNVFLLLVVLHQSIPVDVPDAHGHTALMWAAYNGYPAVVDLFLRWGANVYATDETGMTALHWGLVKGSRGCIQKLIEYGSDRFASSAQGKTPGVTAEEMGTVRIWHRALADCGYNEDGTQMTVGFPLSWILKDRRAFMSKFFFLFPFLMIWSVIMILSHMVVYAAIPIALVSAFAFNWAAKQALPWAPADMRSIHKTPWLAGIFAGTLFWVGVRWVTHILPVTFFSNPFANIFFGVCYGLCAWFYFYSMLEDPGYVPKLASRGQQKAVIEELFSLWKFDEQNFCVHCMLRMPLRSKHCKKCSRCVGKHDHHCPWIYNCVGVNNLRHFFLYIASMEAGIIIFVTLVLSYLEATPSPTPAQCNVLSAEICSILLKDPFTIVLTIWTCLQLTWVTMLLVVQLVQISRAQTTYESMHSRLHAHDEDISTAMTSVITAGTTSLEGAQLASSSSPTPSASGVATPAGPAGAATTAPGMPPGSNVPAQPGIGRRPHPHHRPSEGCLTQWKKLLGIDTFLETAFYGSKGHPDRAGTAAARRRPKNQFSRGVVTNCKDFWCDPAPIFKKRENGVAMLDGVVVNYAKMYDVPPRMKFSRRQGAAYESIAADAV